MIRYAALLLAATALLAQTPQNPSPMVDTTREHRRVPMSEPPGVRWTIGDGGATAGLFLPERFETAEEVDLVVHFMGAAWLPEVAASAQKMPLAIATIVRGDGPPLQEIVAGAEVHLAPRRIRRIFLTAFSAGYRPIRSILRSKIGPRIDGILLLDGLHGSYVPEGKVLAEGGTIDASSVAPFAEFARRAMRGDAVFVITHSEIFPGTFASTTEMTDALLAELGLPRRPVLAWGPLGMQQLSEVHEGRFHVLGFAGNSGPDHIDHFHAIPEMLALLLGRW